MHFRKRILSAVLFALTLCVCNILSSQPNTLKPTGFVNDFAHIISADTSAKLGQLLTAFEQATGIEAAVVTVGSLDDTPVEDFAVTLFEQWGIGKKGKDNGLLILVAPTERKMRIEVGYGLEGAINDAVAGRIIRDTMIPWFKNGDYSTGILNGTVESIDIISKRYDLKFDPAKAGGIEAIQLRKVGQKEGSVFSTILTVIVIIFFIILFIKNPFAALLLLGMGGGRGGSSGGFGGGGFGGFGGGGSGGGGASGGW